MPVQIQKNYEAYLQMKTGPYTGEWVILCEGKIVSHGKELKKAVSEARKKCGKKRLMIAKIPGKETLIY
jgi:hypothetical protein